MIVLDTLTGDKPGVGERWRRLLTAHRITEEDADLIYTFRNSLLHGYGLPRPETTGGRIAVVTDDENGYALDTEEDGVVFLSVPVFCGCLVERIVSEAPEDWDVAPAATNMPPT